MEYALCWGRGLLRVGLFISYALYYVVGERLLEILVAERIWLGDVPKIDIGYDPLADFISPAVVEVVWESTSREDIPSKSLGLL